MIKSCTICGSRNLTYDEVLWPELISQWSLDESEVSYINRQQGLRCVECGNNARSMALCHSIKLHFGLQGTLIEGLDLLASFSVLEINKAGFLTPVLAELPMHRLIEYPEYDIHNMAIQSDSYDLVIHSDVLEHVKNPTAALTECRRLLKPNCVCIFTIPIIVDRLSKSRAGLEPSYHGGPNDQSSDLVVETEYGADFWVQAARAGFKQTGIDILEFPAAMAVKCVR